MNIYARFCSIIYIENIPVTDTSKTEAEEKNTQVSTTVPGAFLSFQPMKTAAYLWSLYFSSHQLLELAYS